MRRKTQKDRLVEAVENYASRAAALADELSRIPCPACGCRALGVEVDPRCGARVTCGGFLEEGNTDEQGACEYYLVDRLVGERDLPVVNSQKEDDEDASRPEKVPGRNHARTQKEPEVDEEPLA